MHDRTILNLCCKPDIKAAIEPSWDVSSSCDNRIKYVLTGFLPAIPWCGMSRSQSLVMHLRWHPGGADLSRTPSSRGHLTPLCKFRMDLHPSTRHILTLPQYYSPSQRAMLYCPAQEVPQLQAGLMLVSLRRFLSWWKSPNFCDCGCWATRIRIVSSYGKQARHVW